MRTGRDTTRAPDAVVWEADDRVFEGLGYGARLVERLEARGLRVRREDLTSVNGRPLAARLHVISGGGTSVSARSGWMPAALALTRSLIDGTGRGEHSLLGVCLGAQMVAEALWPGSVVPSERIEAGLIEVVWQAADNVAGDVFAVPAFHFEEISRSSAVYGGARVVAENARGGLQGFCLGGRLWGVQFHPELEPADVRRLAAYHRHTIESHHNSVAAALASVDRLEPAWSRRTFDRIVDQVTVDGR